MFFSSHTATSTCPSTLVSNSVRISGVHAHVPNHFLHGDPNHTKSASAQVVRSCAAKVWIFGTFHNHVIPETKNCQAHSHANPNDWWLLSRSQIHRTCQANTNQSGVCAPLDLQLLCQQYLGTMRECFHLVSERARGESGSRPPSECSCRILCRCCELSTDLVFA